MIAEDVLQAHGWQFPAGAIMSASDDQYGLYVPYIKDEYWLHPGPGWKTYQLRRRVEDDNGLRFETIYTGPLDSIEELEKHLEKS